MATFEYTSHKDVICKVSTTIISQIQFVIVELEKQPYPIFIPQNAFTSIMTSSILDFNEKANIYSLEYELNPSILNELMIGVKIYGLIYFKTGGKEFESFYKEEKSVRGIDNKKEFEEQQKFFCQQFNRIIARKQKAQCNYLLSELLVWDILIENEKLRFQDLFDTNKEQIKRFEAIESVWVIDNLGKRSGFRKKGNNRSCGLSKNSIQFIYRIPDVVDNQSYYENRGVNKFGEATGAHFINKDFFQAINQIDESDYHLLESSHISVIYYKKGENCSYDVNKLNIVRKDNRIVKFFILRLSGSRKKRLQELNTWDNMRDYADECNREFYSEGTNGEDYSDDVAYWNID